MNTSRVGVVLSSGGGRGVFGHTGFMLALDALGVQPRAIAGCSAGAVVGGMVASGSRIRNWADAIARISTDQFWTPRSVWRLLIDLGLKRGRGVTGLSDTVAAIEFLSTQLTAQTFESCPIPFAAVAVNLGTASKTVFDRGPLAPRIMASAAMPGFYEPVEIEGEFFTDGAIIDLAPAETICCTHQLDVLLVHHVAQRNYTTTDLVSAFDRPWTMVNILHRLVYRRRPWYATGAPRSIHPCPCGCKAVIVVIEPTLTDLTWPATRGAAELINTAQRHAVAQLEPTLDALVNAPRALLRPDAQ